MLHKNRNWTILPVGTAEELAEKLTEHTWCGCNGFEYAGFLFLNDSTSGDGAQEYGIVQNGRQVETVTFGWMKQEKALDYIRKIVSGPAGSLCEPWGEDLTARIQSPEQHGRCYLCA